MPSINPIQSQSVADAQVKQAWLRSDQIACFSSLPAMPAAQTLSSYLQSTVSIGGPPDRNLSIGVEITDQLISQLIFMQCIEFSQRALGNASSNYLSAQRGLETWTKVTNYYSSFFSVHAMLGLQGRCITHTRTANGKMFKLYVYPADLRNHKYVVTTRHLGENPHHVAPWNQYYEIYNRYALPRVQYEVIARKAHITDPTDESVERNLINYTPYSGFSEISAPTQRKAFTGMFFENDKKTLSTKDIIELLDTLNALSSDSEYRYFARSLLKIMFVYEFMNSLPPCNALNYWRPIQKNWTKFLATTLNQRHIGATALRKATSLLSV